MSFNDVRLTYFPGVVGFWQKMSTQHSALEDCFIIKIVNNQGMSEVRPIFSQCEIIINLPPESCSYHRRQNRRRQRLIGI